MGLVRLEEELGVFIGFGWVGILKSIRGGLLQQIGDFLGFLLREIGVKIHF